MSLFPLLYHNWLEDLENPHTMMGQHFGHGFDANSLQSHAHPHPIRSRYYGNLPIGGMGRAPISANYSRPWGEILRQGQGGTSTLKVNKDEFQVVLDVQQFAPEEINVKVIEPRTVVVEAKHEEKRDEHGFVSRQFTRRYIIPEGCEIEKVSSKLSSDGVLSIIVPRIEKANGERRISIEHTGKPAVRENGQAEESPQQPNSQ